MIYNWQKEKSIQNRAFIYKPRDLKNNYVTNMPTYQYKHSLVVVQVHSIIISYLDN